MLVHVFSGGRCLPAGKSASGRNSMRAGRTQAKLQRPGKRAAATKIRRTCSLARRVAQCCSARGRCCCFVSLLLCCFAAAVLFRCCCVVSLLLCCFAAAVLPRRESCDAADMAKPLRHHLRPRLKPRLRQGSCQVQSAMGAKRQRCEQERQRTS